MSVRRRHHYRLHRPAPLHCCCGPACACPSGSYTPSAVATCASTCASTSDSTSASTFAAASTRLLLLALQLHVAVEHAAVQGLAQCAQVAVLL